MRLVLGGSVVLAGELVAEGEPVQYGIAQRNAFVIVAAEMQARAILLKFFDFATNAAITHFVLRDGVGINSVMTENRLPTNAKRFIQIGENKGNLIRTCAER